MRIIADDQLRSNILHFKTVMKPKEDLSLLG